MLRRSALSCSSCVNGGMRKPCQRNTECYSPVLQMALGFGAFRCCICSGITCELSEERVEVGAMPARELHCHTVNTDTSRSASVLVRFALLCLFCCLHGSALHSAGPNGTGRDCGEVKPQMWESRVTPCIHIHSGLGELGCGKIWGEHFSLGPHPSSSASLVNDGAPCIVERHSGSTSHTVERMVTICITRLQTSSAFPALRDWSFSVLA